MVFNKIREFVAQVLFFAAGFDTSATTLVFCMFELAKNPDIQERVHSEIDKVLGRNDGKITYQSIAEMKYLDACIDGERHVNCKLNFVSK